MQNKKLGLRSDKVYVGELSYLYDFICQCPNPRIATALTTLIESWLQHADAVPSFSEEFKKRLHMTADEIIEISWLLAVNPKTPPAVLNELCTDASDTLLERIAENRNTGSTTLAQLSYQAVAEIRIATASNPSTPLASIMLLVKDDNPDVRFSLAENPHVPTEALQILAADDNPYIKMRAEVTLLRADVERNIFNK